MNTTFWRAVGAAAVGVAAYNLILAPLMNSLGLNQIFK